MIWRLAVLLAVAVSAAAPATAQVLYGSVIGNVTDSSGAAAPSVSIVLTQLGTNLSREVQTGDDGTYTFSALPAGTYQLQARKTGFASLTRGGVDVIINNVTRVDLKLQVGEVKETVEVTAEAGVLQTDRTDVHVDLISRQLVDLPIPPGRNYQALFKIIPGVSPPNNLNSASADPSRSLVMNVNGASRSSNSYQIDGSSVNSVWLPNNSGYIPTLEAIETVNVVTNSFSAEQGLAGGSASNVIIKSGSNDLHGSAFEFNNNNATKAKPYVSQPGARKPKSIFNQPGGSVGGRIIRDKLFFFSSYEGTMERQYASSLVTVPIDAIRAGDLSQSPTPVYDPATGASNGTGRTPFTGNQIPLSRISAVSQKLFSMLPRPTYPTALQNNYFAGGGYSFDRHRMDNKINWNASDKLTTFFRFSFLKYTMASDGVFGAIEGPPIASAAGSAGTGFGTTFNGAVGGNYTFSPRFMIDANFGYTLIDTNQNQPNLDKNMGRDVLGIPGTNGTRTFEGGWPTFSVSNYTTFGTSTVNRPIIWHDPRYQYTANATLLRGSHNIRFGLSLSKQGLNQTQPEFVGQLGGASGAFTFAGGVTSLNGGPAANQFNTAGAFLLGLPSSMGRTLIVPDSGFTTRVWQSGLYVRDQWQATRKLTATYGVRWEYFPMPTRADRGLERFDLAVNKMLICGVSSVPTDCGVNQSRRLFSPRAGLAYRATDTLVLRAGYGISVDPYSLSRPMRTNYPIVVVLNVTAPNSYAPAGDLRTGIPAVVAPDTSPGTIPIPGNVAANTLSNNFQRGYIQSWNFTLGKSFGSGIAAEAAYVGTRQIRQIGFVEQNYGVPGGGAAGQVLNAAYGRTATTLLVGSQGNSHYDALQAKIERRSAHGVSLMTSYSFSKSIGMCCNDNSDGNLAIPIPSYLNLNRSVSGFDRTHQFHVSTIYELPFGKGKTFAASGGPAAMLLGGWEISGIFSAYSGLPFTVTDSGTILNAPNNTQRADQVKATVDMPRGVGVGRPWFDPTAFAPVKTPRFGTAGFYILRGPGLGNVDVSLSRTFALRERFKFQFRAEAFNFTNTPHFSLPASNISAASFNTDGTIRALGNFGQITSVTAVGRDGIDERVFRFGLHIGF